MKKNVKIICYISLEQVSQAVRPALQVTAAVLQDYLNEDFFNFKLTRIPIKHIKIDGFFRAQILDQKQLLKVFKDQENV